MPELIPSLGVPPSAARTDWLTDSLREAVVGGVLHEGGRLPATRLLAADLGVARGVVVTAYSRLTDEGLLVARTGAGTVVATRPVTRAVSTARPLPARPLPARVEPSRDADLIDLAPGVPDLSAFPRAAWLRAERTAMNRAAPADLGYGDPRGSDRLRQQLSQWLRRQRGVLVDPENLVVVAGVAQSLALLATVLKARGIDEIGMEDPGSRGARELLEYWGMGVRPVPVDDDGLRVDRLDDLRAVLVTPAHQYPTGVVLGPARRRELAAWAQAGGLVVEDDYDAEFRYDRHPVTAVQPLAPEQVVYAGSVSKTLASGLRMGWLAAPDRIRDDVVEAKRHSDLGTGALAQLAFAEFVDSGALERHLRAVRLRHRRRRAALLEALAHHVPAATPSGVAAGLHVLLRIGESEVDVALTERIGRAGVRVHPLSWHRVEPGPGGLILGYGAQTPDRLVEAARRIGTVLGNGQPFRRTRRSVL